MISLLIIDESLPFCLDYLCKDSLLLKFSCDYGIEVSLCIKPSNATILIKIGPIGHDWLGEKGIIMSISVANFKSDCILFLSFSNFKEPIQMQKSFFASLKILKYFRSLYSKNLKKCKCKSFLFNIVLSLNEARFQETEER